MLQRNSLCKGADPAAHGSYIVTTKSSQSVSLLKKLSPIPTLKTTRENRGRRKNVARELISAEGLISAKKRATNGGRKEGVLSKCKEIAPVKHSASCICPVRGVNYYDENLGQDLVQCCGSCSSWFLEKYVELASDFYCKEYSV
ncbi:hypothetical protein TNCV_1952281 [Trichonephila clavipes]|nr:hypothetical protein TNCV_1952281 [Trichonephila clavipes]